MLPSHALGFGSFSFWPSPTAVQMWWRYFKEFRIRFCTLLVWHQCRSLILLMNVRISNGRKTTMIYEYYDMLPVELINQTTESIKRNRSCDFLPFTQLWNGCEMPTLPSRRQPDASHSPIRPFRYHTSGIRGKHHLKLGNVEVLFLKGTHERRQRQRRVSNNLNNKIKANEALHWSHLTQLQGGLYTACAARSTDHRVSL